MIVNPEAKASAYLRLSALLSEWGFERVDVRTPAAGRTNRKADAA